jgi:hypothetical protein
MASLKGNPALIKASQRETVQECLRIALSIRPVAIGIADPFLATFS